MKDFGVDCGTLFGTPLVFAGQLWHRVIVNKEPPMRVARDLGLTKPQVVGACRLLRATGYVPSAARLAVAAMVVPDVTDHDIADWFDKDRAWAADVRQNADHWREKEYIPAQLEYLDDGYQPGDPTPSEIQEAAAEIRRKHPRESAARMPAVTMPNYAWNGSKHAFLQIGPQ